MRGRSFGRRASIALVLGLGLAAGPISTPAQADCVELTFYVTWEGTDPFGQTTTPVHDGCITETGASHGIRIGPDSHENTGQPTGTPDGWYFYLRVPIPFW